MNLKKWFPLIGILIFIYILIKIDLLEVLGEIKNANLMFIFIALLFVFIMFFIQTFKWFSIAVFQDIKMPFLDAVKINLITNFYGFVTPSKLGTIVRAEYLKKYTGNYGKGLCNFTLDKILDIASVIFLAILFSFMFKDKLNLPIGIFVLFFLCFILVSLFFMSKNRSKFILKIFYRRFVPEKMKDTAKVTFNSFYDHIPQKRYFILFFLLNLINWVNLYLITYFVGRSLGIELSFIYYLAILPITTLVTLIPITINGLGTQEATMISLFSLFGIESTKVFSMSIINLLIGILASLIGIFFIWKNR
jgi:glycosyltransferase 2 family protein